MNNKTVFKRTGNNVTVSRDDLINKVIERLSKYDSLPPKQRKEISNPYVEPIYTHVEGGKTVQVPRYIQHGAITKWRILKTRECQFGGHTRVMKRGRYVGIDPHIINKDIINSVVPEPERNLYMLRNHEAIVRSEVGRVNVPDYQFGRGGSYGDLPRDFEIYDNNMSQRVMDRRNFGNHPEAGQFLPDDTNDPEYPYDMNDINYQQESVLRSRKSVGYDKNTLPDMNNTGKNILIDDVAGLVPGEEPNLSPDNNNIETHGVEHYAPIEFDDVHDNVHDNVRENDVDEYDEGECEKCRENIETNGYDKYQLYEKTREAPHDKDFIEPYDGSGECTESAYKYLFFALLLLVLFAYFYKLY